MEGMVMRKVKGDGNGCRGWRVKGHCSGLGAMHGEFPGGAGGFSCWDALIESNGFRRNGQGSPGRFSVRLGLCLAVILVLTAFPVVRALAHNLGTTMVYMFYDPATQKMLDTRVEDPAWIPPQSLFKNGDELGIVIKVVPKDGTTTGVGGHVDFYVPNGVQVMDAAYLLPGGTQITDGVVGYDKVPMKGQSLIAVGAGPVGAKATSQLIGLTGTYTNVNGVTEDPVVSATGLHRGTIAGVYGDTGIFYSTHPDTAYGTWQSFTGGNPEICGLPATDPALVGSKTITNNFGQSFVPCNLWDAGQMFAWGVKGTTCAQPGCTATPIVDYLDGRGNAPWGFASGVAGPQSGYKWNFDWEEWRASARDAAAMRAAMGPESVGPWQRIKYPGSRVSLDQAGSAGTALGIASVDAGNIGAGLPLAPTTSQTNGTSPNAVRWAVGQLTSLVPEYVWVKIKINDLDALLNEDGCPVFNGDTFGGDAGGTDTGKDHLWRYYQPSRVTWNGCTGIGKPTAEAAVKVGDIFQYRVKYYNAGTHPMENVVIRDLLPSGVQFMSAFPAQDTGPNPLVWNLGTVLPGEKFESLVTVKATGTGALTNTICIDSAQEDGCSQEIVPSGLYPILKQNKTVTPTAVAPGATVQYTVTVENIGSGPTGNPVKIEERLPPELSFVSLDSVMVNGADYKSSTVTTTGVEGPIFAVPTSIGADQTLTLKLTARVNTTAVPGSYCNSFTSWQNGIPITTGSLACITVAGGKIGDTLYRDWDGDGAQDAGEEGIAGVNVYLYASDGTTLRATTTTDGAGHYAFPGLAAGTYVVKVNNGVAPSGTTQTGDPDGTLDNVHTVTLSTDQQYTTADFGYRPTGTAAIGDKVFEDIGNDGVFTAGTDTGIAGVTVYLYEDSNGDGAITPGVDALVASTTTDGSGNYSFTGLAAGYDYLVKVDKADPDIQTYFNTKYDPDPVPYQLSTVETRSSLDLTGSDVDNDFGFWRVMPASIGDQVFIDADGNGTFGGGDTPLAGVTVTLVRDGQPFATAVSGPDGKYLFNNLGPGTYSVTVDAGSAGVPAGYSPGASHYNVTLVPGQEYLSADFPFVPLIAKTVDKTSATPGQTLNYGINVNYPGDTLLSDVTVRDFLPAGTTFSSAGQGGTLQTFSPIPGTAGQSTFGTTISRVYAFRGGSTATFWAYDPAGNTWDTTLPSAPGTITTGGALTSDGSRYIYAFQGGSRAFYRYDAITRTWSDSAVADLPPAAPVVGAGGALVYRSGYVNAFVGGGTAGFWRYDVAANTWTQLTNAPGAIGAGGSLATDGSDVYGLAGGGSQVIYIYDTAAGTWSTSSTSGRNFGAGAGLAFGEDGTFYATTGAGDNRIYRYDPALNSWTQGINGANVSAGGALATDGVTFFMMRGANTQEFYDRRFSGSNVALADTPAIPSGGGALTYLSCPGAVAGSSMTAAPNVAALGSPFTVTLTLTSTQALSGVTPSALQVTGGSATVSGPTPASLNLAANTPGTFTWTVTPGKVGEFVFWAGAGNGTITFETAKSNSVLVSPNGQSQFLGWNLGSNDPGTTGTTAANLYLYAFGGNDTQAFWAFNTATGSWNNPLDPADTPSGVTVKEGGALTNDGVRYIYALRGDNTRVFLRYDTTTNTWDDSGIADLPATTDKTVLKGGSLAYLNGYVYAFIGNGSRQFWHYSVSGNSWTQMTIAPAAVGNGGGLTSDGTNLYATQGAGKAGFWRYNVASNSWTTLAVTPANVGDGGGLVYANGAVYVLRGAGQKTFWRYNIATNTWTTLATTPGNIDDGGAIKFDGQYLRVLQGKTTGFYRYDISTGVWETRAVTPATVGWGGALTYLPTGNVSRTAASAAPTLVRGVSQAVIRMTVTSDSAISNIAANAPTYTATGGATATFGPATLVSPDDDISGTGDPVIYEWIATVTAGSSIGDIHFTTSSSLGVSAKTNSVIVTPTLTFAVTVNDPAPPAIANTALLNEIDVPIQNVSSNTSETYTTATIGDRVWADLDGDGAQDSGETGLSGVKIYVDSNGNGVWDAGEPSDVTDAGGNYCLANLTAGTYTVRIDPATYPAGYIPTTAGSLTANLPTGLTQLTDVDFGLQPPPLAGQAGSIGDRVWLDADNDGVQDAGELPLSGITVHLYRDLNHDGVLDATDPLVATDVTGADGLYSFDGLPFGSYIVAVDQTSTVTSPYGGGTFGLGAAMDPTYDRNGGLDNQTAVTVSSATPVTDVDFGYNWSGTIGDTVWMDANHNGTPDSGEAPAASAIVLLYFDVNGNGILDVAEGDTQVGFARTDVNGTYHLGNLPPGPYLVDVYEDSVISGGVRDMVPTTPDVRYKSLAAGETYNGADFGYYQGARVDGNVFRDLNHNSVFDATETGLTPVTVTLAGTDKYGNAVSLTTQTNADGHFTFLVPEGDYTLTYSDANVLAIDPTLSDKTTPSSTTFHALPGADWHPTFDFGVDNSGKLGDRLWNDADGDGVQDTGELGIAGVTVKLYLDPNGDGNLADATLLEVKATGASGNYLFEGLANTKNSEKYVVVVDSTGASLNGFTQTFDPDGTLNHWSATTLTGVPVLTLDFGYRAPGYPVSGRLFDSSNNSALLGVTVCLYDSTGTTVRACTTTDSSGNYTFPGIPNGSVLVRVDTDTLPSTAYYQTVDPDGSLNNETPVTVSGAPVSGKDFGYMQNLGSVSGTVAGTSAQPADGDGLAEPGEGPQTGVTVFLTWAGPDGIIGNGDDRVFTTRTDANGDHSFTGLEPGYYQVSKINPQGTTNLADADGGNPNSISLVLDFGPDGTAGTADDRMTRVDQDFEVKIATGSIGDRVWLDVDRDGVQDVGEPGLGNVAVALWSAGADGVAGTADDRIVATTVTDLNGNYLFTDVDAGKYAVKVDKSTLPFAGLTETAGNNSSTSALIDLRSGGSYLTADFGYVGDASRAIIGDFVWSDADSDGIQDPGEPGIGGVTLRLLDALTGDPVVDPNAVGTQDYVVTTGADGGYAFTNLPPGAYLVEVTDIQGKLQGYTLTTGPQSNPDPTNPITVSAGQSALAADFGYVNATLHDVTDRVWYDADRDGVRDAGEAGIAGVTVNLYSDTDGDGGFTKDVVDGKVDLNGDGKIDASDSTAAGTTWNGFQVIAGQVDTNHDGFISELDDGSVNGLPVVDGMLDVNGDGSVTSADDGVVVDETITATAITDDVGNFSFTGLLDGNYVMEIADNSGQLTGYQGTTPDAQAYMRPVTVSGSNLTGTHFGYAGLGPIGDTVFSDADGDGVQDPGEPGIAGVVIRLYRDDGDGVFEPGTAEGQDGDPIATTTTDAGGSYTFGDLAPGPYFVSIETGQAVLSGYTATSTDEEPAAVGAGSTEIAATLATGAATVSVLQGGMDLNGDGIVTGADDGQAHGVQVMDGRLDLNGDGAVTVADGGWWNGVQVIGGRLDTSGNGSIDGTDNGVVTVSEPSYVHADFGYQNSSLKDVSGSIWNDLNENAVDDGTGEPPLAGVTVVLTDSAGNVIATAVTDQNGAYHFYDVPAGNYVVEVTDESGVLSGYRLTSGLDSIPVTVSSTDVTGIDFGYVRGGGTGSIGDAVWLDANGDWVFGANESGLSGVTVRLYEAGPDGVSGTADDVLVDTAVTDARGRYLFDGLAAGTYTVDVVSGVPAGLTLSAGTDPSAVIRLSDGQSVLNADFGYKPDATTAVLGDTVWVDADGDGTRDAGEVGMGGVVVQVLNQVTGDVVATVTTNPDGSWFAAIPEDATPTEYVVFVDKSTLPGGIVSTPTNMNGGDTYLVSVKGGDTRTNLDFGYQGGTSGAIGDSVFLDANQNGTLDPGEGLSGVTLNLTTIGIIDGKVDVNGDGLITAADDGSYGGYRVIGGALDTDGNGSITAADDGTVNGIPVIDGLLDVNRNGAVNDSDDRPAMVVATRTTDADGRYLFTGLLAGDYRVDVAGGIPTGLTLTTGSDPTAVITLGAGAVYTNADFGYGPSGITAAIGDRIWSDADGDGTQDSGEAGIAGVIVFLDQDADGLLDWTDMNENGKWDPGEGERWTTSDADGSYLLTSVPAGTYTVTALTPGGYAQTGDPDGAVMDGKTTVTVAVGSTWLAADFGYQYQGAGGSGSIGGTLYDDLDGDKTPDGGETGIAGVTLNLVGAGADGIFGTADDTVIATTATDASGAYDFTGLPPGDYRVQVSDQANVLAGLTATQVSSQTFTVDCATGTCDHGSVNFGYMSATTGSGSIGDLVYFDADGDGTQDGNEVGIQGVTLNLLGPGSDGIMGTSDDKVVATKTTDAGGNYTFDGLTAGTYRVVVTDTGRVLGGLTPTQTAGDQTITCSGSTCDAVTNADFGYKSTTGGTGTLGGTVWHDTIQTAATGVLDPGEPRIQGVTVELWLDTNGNGAIEPGTDNLVRTTLSNANGDYLFLGLPPSRYVIRTTDANGVLAGMTAVTGPAPNNDGNGHVSPYPVNLQLGEVNTSVDFGYEATAGGAYTLSGTVFEDAGTSKGTYDPPPGGDDALVPGATVSLYRLVNGIEYLVGNTVSDGYGNYSFTDLPPGTYVVKVDVSATFVNGFEQTVDPDTVLDSKTTITMAGDTANINFGYWNGDVVTTPVTLAYFRSTENGGLWTFEWITGKELGNVGFHLYVETPQGRIRVNNELIPSRVVSSAEPQRYAFEAAEDGGGAFWLSDLDVRGREVFHGPYEPEKAYGKKPVVKRIDWKAAQAEHGAKKEMRNLAAASIQAEASGELAPLGAASQRAEFNLSVTKDGIHRVTYEELLAAGINLTRVRVGRMTLTNRGFPVPIRVVGEKGGSSPGANFGPGGFIEFIGLAGESIYSDANAYVLAVSGAATARVVINKDAPPRDAVAVPYYLETARVDRNRSYTPMAPGLDPWFDEYLLAWGGAAEGRYSVNIDQLAGDAGVTGALHVGLWGVTNFPVAPDHQVVVRFNDVKLAEAFFDGQAEHPVEAQLPAGLLKEGGNTVTLRLPFTELDASVEYDMVALDQFSVVYPRRFVAKQGRLTFTAAGDFFSVSGLPNSSVVVYRQRVDGMVEWLTNVKVSGAAGAYTVNFRGLGGIAATYFVSSLDAVWKPRSMEPAAMPVSCREGDPARYLVIAHPDFINTDLDRLVSARRQQGYSARVVPVDGLYARYSGHMEDPEAIRSCIADAHANLGTEAVLLVGGDTYDYRDYLGVGSVSFIPSLYARTDSLVRHAPVDALYADVDRDNVPDLAIGRLPVRSSAELAGVVDHTLNYAGKVYGKTAVLAADRYDAVNGYDFRKDSEEIGAKLPVDWTVKKAYVDNLGVSGARKVLIDAINAGTALTGFVGHSYEQGWTFEGLFGYSDVDKLLTNVGRPTVVAQWGCWNTYYVLPTANTLGHEFMLSGSVGAAAVLGASTLTEAAAESRLGKTLFNHLIQPGMTIGDAVLHAKRDLAAETPGQLDVILGWQLLGDPLLVVDDGR